MVSRIQDSVVHPQSIDCKEYAWRLIGGHCRGPMDGAQALVAWPGTALEQHEVERCGLKNPRRILCQAGGRVGRPVRACAGFSAIGRTIIQPFGRRAPIRAQQAQSDLVDMESRAHGPADQLEPNAHGGTADQVREKFLQARNVRPDSVGEWALRQAVRGATLRRRHSGSEAVHELPLAGEKIEAP